VALNPARHYTAHNNLAKLLHLRAGRMADRAASRQSSTGPRRATNGGFGQDSDDDDSDDGGGDDDDGGAAMLAAEVEHHYREALRIFPAYGTAAYNLATWLHAQGPATAEAQAAGAAVASTGASTAAVSNSTASGAIAAAAEPPAAVAAGQSYAAWFGETAGLYRRAIVAAPGLFESYYNLASLLLGGAQRLPDAVPAKAAILSEASQLLNFAVRAAPPRFRSRTLNIRRLLPSTLRLPS